MLYYFSWFVAQKLQICLFIAVYQTAVGIIGPVEISNVASHYR